MKNEPPMEGKISLTVQALYEWDALLKRLQAGPGTDARVNELRAAIARGELQIDARAIAERLIGRLLAS